MPYGELESEALCDEEFQVEDIRGSSLGDVGGVCLKGYWVVCCFGREEEGS